MSIQSTILASYLLMLLCGLKGAAEFWLLWTMPVHLCSMSKRRGKARNILGPLLCLHYIDLISYSHIIFVNLIEFESESSISSNKWPAACRRCPSLPVPRAWDDQLEPAGKTRIRAFQPISGIKIRTRSPASRGEGAGAINAFHIPTCLQSLSVSVYTDQGVAAISKL